MTTIPCPSCNGAKTVRVFVDGVRDGRRFGELRDVACHVCRGLGEISQEYADRMVVAERIRHKRVEAELTGSELAAILGMDRVALSHTEQGRPDSEADWQKLREWGGEQCATEN